jgi:LPS-assembly lipoprotein
MSSLKLPLLGRFPLFGGFVVLAMLALAGCQVRPLYATTSVEAGPQADMPAIEVDPPLNRPEQSYRNALLLALRGGGDGTDPRFKLIYRLTITEVGIALERGTGAPNAYQMTGGASFLLKDSATDESLYGASVTSTDSYTRSSQNFANTRARIDAEQRLTENLADLTQARLAAYFATR